MTLHSAADDTLSTESLNTDVLIVGAGPVGLAAAIDLNSRGISVVIVETRAYKEPPSVKCNHVSARTMEQFRRLGIAQLIRNVGLPADYPNDAAFRTSMTGQEITRIPIPCRRDRYTSTEGPDTWWPTPEPPHRINQTFLEPTLVEHAAALEHVTLLNQTACRGFAQDDDGVTATAESLTDGRQLTIRARFLLGCDGGSSTVRKAIGAKFEGDAVVQRVQSTCIRAAGLYDLMPGKPAWAYYSINPRRNGTVFPIDGVETFLVHNHLNPSEEFEDIDRDTSIRAILGVDEDFPYDVVSYEDWTGRRLVADRFRDRRVFIAGDSGHLWVPYGGYGMNAGIADVLNLTWALGAYLAGWADAGILDAYEAERLPITRQVSKFAMSHAEAMIKARIAAPREIADDTPAGEAARAAHARPTYELNVAQFACAGLNFGYYYQESPIIVADGEQAPAYTMGDFTASTVPGCRAPHFWLPGHQSVYDGFGPGYTLLRIDEAVDVSGLVRAAEAAGMPLTVIDVPAGVAPDTYRHALVLCRHDQHIAWRGNRLPDDPHELVQVLRGARSNVVSSPAAAS